MGDKPAINKYTLPEYAVDVIVKSELHRTAIYENESRERLACIKEDVELRRGLARIQKRIFELSIYQFLLFTLAFAWWVLK